MAKKYVTAVIVGCFEDILFQIHEKIRLGSSIESCF